MGRYLAWFSCGAASAVVAKLATEKYSNVEVLYCDTFAYEHPDNRRFFNEVQDWIGQEIKILKSDKYKDIYDVFRQTKFLVSPFGARCTTELKKVPRMKYQRPDDIHLFGMTIEEKQRVTRFKKRNPEVLAEFPLIEENIGKQGCLSILPLAGIELPEMYKLGYNNNNNCIGCVKGGAGYWNKIREDFPEHFIKMSKMERELNISILRNNDNPLFLDELPKGIGRHSSEYVMSCGVTCTSENVDRDIAPLLKSKYKTTIRQPLPRKLF